MEFLSKNSKKQQRNRVCHWKKIAGKIFQYNGSVCVIWWAQVVFLEINGNLLFLVKLEKISWWGVVFGISSNFHFWKGLAWTFPRVYPLSNRRSPSISTFKWTFPLVRYISNGHFPEYTHWNFKIFSNFLYFPLTKSKFHVILYI